MRVRKNAAKMTAEEWTRFCKAVVALKHTRYAGSSVSIYDQFVAQHGAVRDLETGGEKVADGGHRGPAFLTWHREYLRRFEAALMAVDPRVTLPYWNWGLGDASETTALFGDDRLGPRQGEAGTGSITSGYFSKAGRNGLAWTIHESLRLSTEDTLLRSDSWSVGSLPTMGDILSILALPSYEHTDNNKNFRLRLEAIHGDVHVLVGRRNRREGEDKDVVGHMARAAVSPNDPIFFLHHAQVDRLWALWQMRHPNVPHFIDDENRQGHSASENMWPWNNGQSTPRQTVHQGLVPTFASTDIVRNMDMFDTRALGYIYDGEDAAREIGSVNVTHDWQSVQLLGKYGRRQAIVAGMQTFADADTAGVRVHHTGGRAVEIMVEEEGSKDAERAHAPESVAYLAGKQGVIRNAAGEVVGELGVLRMSNMTGDWWETVHFQHEYTAAIVVATISSYHGSHPAHMRVRDVGTSSFRMAIEEWLYLGAHREHWTEDVSYLVLESGQHRLRDGRQVVAGSASVNHSWKSVMFESALSGDTLVLSQCMSLKGSDPVVTRQRNVGSAGFDVRLQEEEGRDGTHAIESVGYIAMGSS